MTITCTRRIQFCAGHRVMGHENKCAHPHGHNYVAFITAAAKELDGVGRVIDFSVLKEQIGGWIDRSWDHGFIYAAADSVMEYLFRPGHSHGQSFKSFALPWNPTAENMAEYLLSVVCPGELEGSGVLVTKVVIWETENCFATAELTKVEVDQFEFLMKTIKEA